MNLSLLVVGSMKLSAGVVAGALVVLCAHLLVIRGLRLGAVADNPAAATVYGSVLLALAVLLHRSVEAMGDTLDVLLRQGATRGAVGLALGAGVAHLVLGLALAAGALGMGVWLFNRLTPGVDEVALVREGKVAPAIILGAMVVTLAVVLSPGLEALLDGFIPYPALPEGVEVAPP